MSKRTLAGIAVLLLPLALAAPAAASSVDVDESKLVPPLSASFAPWICKMKITGPVCDGERHLSSTGSLLPTFRAMCHSTVDARRTGTPHASTTTTTSMTTVRSAPTTWTSSARRSPARPARPFAPTLASEPFAVPGADTTRDIITDGVIWDIQRRARTPGLDRRRDARRATRRSRHLHRPRHQGRSDHHLRRRAA